MTDERFLVKLFALGNSYWLTRFVILRLLGFVYAVAFLVAAQQLVPLIGEHGLTPATHFLANVQAQVGSRTAGTLRGEPSWCDLTCLHSDYQTLSAPSPISRRLPVAALWFHEIATAWIDVVELVVLWFSFGPRRARHVACVLLITLQLFLFISGT